MGDGDGEDYPKTEYSVRADFGPPINSKDAKEGRSSDVQGFWDLRTTDRESIIVGGLAIILVFFLAFTVSLVHTPYSAQFIMDDAFSLSHSGPTNMSISTSEGTNLNSDIKCNRLEEQIVAGEVGYRCKVPAPPEENQALYNCSDIEFVWKEAGNTNVVHNAKQTPLIEVFVADNDDDGSSRGEFGNDSSDEGSSREGFSNDEKHEVIEPKQDRSNCGWMNIHAPNPPGRYYLSVGVVPEGSSNPVNSSNVVADSDKPVKVYRYSDILDAQWKRQIYPLHILVTVVITIELLQVIATIKYS